MQPKSVTQLLAMPCKYFLKSAGMPSAKVFSYRESFLMKYGLPLCHINTPWSHYHDELMGRLEATYTYGSGGSRTPTDPPIMTGREHTFDEINISPSSSELQSWPYCFMDHRVLFTQLQNELNTAKSINLFLATHKKELVINGGKITNESELVAIVDQMQATIPDLDREQAWVAIITAINTGETDLEINYADEGATFYALKSWSGDTSKEHNIQFLITQDELESIALNRNARIALKLLNQFGTHTDLWEVKTTKKTMFVSNNTRPIAVKNQNGGQSALNQKYNNISVKQYITVAPRAHLFEQNNSEDYDAYCLSREFYDLASSKFRGLI